MAVKIADLGDINTTFEVIDINTDKYGRMFVRVKINHSVGGRQDQNFPEYLTLYKLDTVTVTKPMILSIG